MHTRIRTHSNTEAIQERIVHNDIRAVRFGPHNHRLRRIGLLDLSELRAPAKPSRDSAGEVVEREAQHLQAAAIDLSWEGPSERIVRKVDHLDGRQLCVHPRRYATVATHKLIAC
jgi:hypothetical protein